MTQPEFDSLVRTIGDELLARLGGSAGYARAWDSSCGCEGMTQEGSTAPVGAAREFYEAIADWTPPQAGVARLIDHTELRPDATDLDIRQLCTEARHFRFASVCVQPSRVAQAVRELHGSPVLVGTVIGFPHGATLTPAKVEEAAQALKLGAGELDMVIAVGALKAGDLEFVHMDVRAVVEMARRRGALVKVILEMSLLTNEEKMKGCVVAKIAGADFVKTSTGFGPAGADPSDVALLRRVVGPDMGVKAAGGIRSLGRLRKMVAAGATRIGTSASVAIMRESGVWQSQSTELA